VMNKLTSKAKDFCMPIKASSNKTKILCIFMIYLFQPYLMQKEHC
jgi:hypothetical protein